MTPEREGGGERERDRQTERKTDREREREIQSLKFSKVSVLVYLI
jgi:hypothetical protein